MKIMRSMPSSRFFCNWLMSRPFWASDSFFLKKQTGPDNPLGLLQLSNFVIHCSSFYIQSVFNRLSALSG